MVVYLFKDFSSQGLMTVTFLKKKDAKEKRKGNEIIAASTLAHYFIVKNHVELLELINESPIKNYYEYISSDALVNMYFDVEIYNFNDEDGVFNNPLKIINSIKEAINSQTFLKHLNKKWIVLESHNNEKKSFHIIVRLTDDEGQEWYFKNVGELKTLYNLLNFGKYKSGNDAYIIDPKVYRDGLFRTIHSSKEGQQRYLKESDITDAFHDIDSFVCYTRNTECILPKINAKLKTDIQKTVKALDTKLDETTISLIKDTVQTLYNASKDLIGEPYLNTDGICIIIPSTIKYCPFIKREHKSNHVYFLLDNYSIRQKCHDSDCQYQKANERKVNSLDPTLLLKLKGYLDITPDNINKIDSGIKECKNLLKLYDMNCDDIYYNQSNKTFTCYVSDKSIINVSGNCDKCIGTHTIDKHGYYLVCNTCKVRYPNDTYFPTNPQIQLYFQETEIEALPQAENSSIVIDESIYNDVFITTLMCDALNGHKVNPLAEIFSKINNNFVYDSIWYYFNGNTWQTDKNTITIARTIYVELTECVNKIKRHYQLNPEFTDLLKNIDNLVIQLSKPRFENEIATALRHFCFKKDFKTLLNSKTYLIPFSNGVYDLHQNKFRVIEREDYIEKILEYDYDPTIPTDDVERFISEILSNKNVRDYFLTHLSYTLNGELSNEYFHILNGSGSNGKSQIINLIVEALGKFTYKPDISLITKNRTDSSNATPQKAGLYNIRFAYFAEPNYNDKFNAGLLKEMTGNEDIIARNLYEDAFTFRIHAKFWLACNQIPDIDGDKAVWRRVRVIDFNSKFVDNPTRPNEFLKDPDIPNKIKNDPSFKKGLVNLLLRYYYNPHPEVPPEVTSKTQEYIEQNQEIFNWCNENIIQDPTQVLKPKDVYEQYIHYDPKMPRNGFYKILKQYFQDVYNTTYKTGQKNDEGEKISGYKGFDLGEN